MLTVRLDSMLVELEKNAYAVDLLNQIDLYLDSIDASIKWIKVDHELGASEVTSIQKIKYLTGYLQNAEEVIVALEARQKSNSAQLQGLRKEISEKELAIKELKLSLTTLEDEKAELQDLLTLSKEENVDAQLELDKSSMELEKSKAEIQELLSKMERAQAESFYALGEGMEEVAKRTQFARKRKRQSWTDALNYFEQSYEMGFEPAKAKADELKSKLKIEV